MKVILEIKDNPQNGDILIFNGKEWQCKNQDIVIKKLREKINLLEKENVILKNEFEHLKMSVNDKLKDYHNILQVLTKEE